MQHLGTRPRTRGWVAAFIIASALVAAGPTAQAQGSFTGKPVYSIEARRAGVVLGTISVELFPAIAPRHTWNWDSLTAARFFDTTAFHRVIPGFMIQGGDPNSRRGPRSTWGYGQPGQPNVPAEFSAVSHERGILSAARDANPNSANSQFFICVAAARHLNGQYSAYGRVRGGMAVVDQIVSAPRDVNDNPLQKIEMFVRYVRSNDTAATAPVLLAPADRAGGQPETPVLRWRAAPDAMLYDVQASTDSTFATNLIADVVLSQRDSSLTLAALPPATTYFWRVRANNGGSASGWAGRWRFRTGVAAPVLQTPANNAATGISTTPTLTWAPVAAATTYEVQVSRGARFLPAQIVAQQTGLATPQWDVSTPLTLNQRAYWRARAVLGTEPGYWSAAFSFTPTVVTAVAPDHATGPLLAAVAPNPVGAAGAVVEFTLPAGGSVALTLADVLGRPVAWPVPPGYRAAGAHRAALHTRGLTPGVYVLRLDANGQRLTQRVIIE